MPPKPLAKEYFFEALASRYLLLSVPPPLPAACALHPCQATALPLPISLSAYPVLITARPQLCPLCPALHSQRGSGPAAGCRAWFERPCTAASSPAALGRLVPPGRAPTACLPPSLSCAAPTFLSLTLCRSVPCTHGRPLPPPLGPLRHPRRMPPLFLRRRSGSPPPRPGSLILCFRSLFRSASPAYV